MERRGGWRGDESGVKRGEEEKIGEGGEKTRRGCGGEEIRREERVEGR